MDHKKILNILYVSLVLLIIFPFLELFVYFKGIFLSILSSFYLAFLIATIIPCLEFKFYNKSVKEAIMKSMILIGGVAIFDIINFFLKFVVLRTDNAEFAGLQWVIAIFLFIALLIINSIILYLINRRRNVA